MLLALDHVLGNPDRHLRHVAAYLIPVASDRSRHPNRRSLRSVNSIQEKRRFASAFSCNEKRVHLFIGAAAPDVAEIK